MSALIILVNVCVLICLVRSDGFMSWCHFNETMFVPKHNSATFHLSTNAEKSEHIRLSKLNATRLSIYVHIDNISDWSQLTVHFIDKQLQNRTHVSGHNHGMTGQVTMVISNISQADGGFYILRADTNYCYQLYVMEIWSSKEEVEEGTSVYVHASPSRLDITDKNVTVTWLVAGFDVDQSSSFIVIDSKIWIPNVSRNLNNKNVSYRIQDDNGVLHCVNYILQVTYGPSEPLMLSPNKEFYVLRSGQFMPDITCSVDCNPKCLVTWTNYSTCNVLQLGVVNLSYTGVYTCRAVSSSGNLSVQRSVVVFVRDEPDWSIQIKPNRTTYVVSDGDVIPDVQCQSDCGPACNVTWGIHSSTYILTLGKVTQKSSGLYTCIVTRHESSRRMEKSITVIVTGRENNDDTMNKAITTFSVLLPLSILGTICFVLCLYIRSVKPGCITCVRKLYQHQTADEYMSSIINKANRQNDHD